MLTFKESTFQLSSVHAMPHGPLCEQIHLLTVAEASLIDQHEGDYEHGDIKQAFVSLKASLLKASLAAGGQ